jgi:hypothetical protein
MKKWKAVDGRVFPPGFFFNSSSTIFMKEILEESKRLDGFNGVHSHIG